MAKKAPEKVATTSPPKKRDKATSKIQMYEVLPPQEKAKKVKAVLADLNKRMGPNTICTVPDRVYVDCGVVPTGSELLDRALGIGGMPRGRIVEVFGPENSGKSFLTLSVIAQAQKAGGLCAFIDAEHALDLKFARETAGVDTDSLVISQPDTAEQALEIVVTLAESGVFDVIVLDSLAAMTPEVELDGDMGDSHMGLQARLLSQFGRKVKGILSKTQTLLIAVNQTRSKIGVVFGSPETTTGGAAMKFYASLRLRISKFGVLKEAGSEYTVGWKMRVLVYKTKVAPPPSDATELDIFIGKGFFVEKEMIQLALKCGAARKDGAWYYTAADKRLAQGLDAAAAVLIACPDLKDEVRRDLDAAS